MHLFIDTETSGLPDFRAPPDARHQPHIVSLAAWLGEEDETSDALRHVASLNAVIKPDGWSIDPKAEAVHKISEEYARSFGEPLGLVLTRLVQLVTQAFEGSSDSLLIAHNFQFDHRMLLRDFAYAQRDFITLNLLRPFCTMRALTPRMRLPPRRGAPAGSFKWPKLDEAYTYLFARPVPGREDRHDAMADVLACKDVFEEGRRREWW
jgi:DNA polymerase-3 subunit epsilon